MVKIIFNAKSISKHINNAQWKREIVWENNFVDEEESETEKKNGRINSVLSERNVFDVQQFVNLASCVYAPIYTEKLYMCVKQKQTTQNV